MTERDKEEKCPYPSLDLAFEWVKGVLYHQKQLAEEYSGKLSTLFSVATAILGIGLPLGMKFAEDAFDPHSGSFIAVIAAMATYFLIAVLAVVGFWMRDYVVLDNPALIREWYWDLAPWKFKEQILGHFEDAYDKNNKTLRWRVWPTQAIIILLPIETLALAIAFILAL